MLLVYKKPTNLPTDAKTEKIDFATKKLLLHQLIIFHQQFKRQIQFMVQLTNHVKC